MARRAHAALRNGFGTGGAVRRGEWPEVTLWDCTRPVERRSCRGAGLSDVADAALVTLESLDRAGGIRTHGLKPCAGPLTEDEIIGPGEMVVSLTDITQNGDSQG